MKTVDTIGLLCPKPLIKTKKVLSGCKPGEKIKILTDNDTSRKNLLAFLSDQGVEPVVTSDRGIYTIIADVPVNLSTEVDAESYCSTEKNPEDYVICIKSDTMGDGDPALGKRLLETFLTNLNVQKNIPTHILLYNSGVSLVKKDSPVLEALRELEKSGIRVMVCGTCIEHFGIQKEVGVGMISNMVSITEVLVNAGNVIYP